jgi:hypothetical protein
MSRLRAQTPQKFPAQRRKQPGLDLGDIPDLSLLFG